jgi:hypothetical protein
LAFKFTLAFLFPLATKLTLAFLFTLAFTLTADDLEHLEPAPQPKRGVVGL